MNFANEQALKAHYELNLDCYFDAEDWIYFLDRKLATKALARVGEGFETAELEELA